MNYNPTMLKYLILLVFWSIMYRLCWRVFTIPTQSCNWISETEWQERKQVIILPFLDMQIILAP